MRNAFRLFLAVLAAAIAGTGRADPRVERWPAIHVLVMEDDPVPVERRLEREPELANAVDDVCGVAPLQVCRSARMAGVLLARGARVNHRDGLDETPLIDAAAAGREDVVRLLVRHGADVDFAGQSDYGNGYAALHAAADRRTAEALLEAGAKLDNAGGRTGATPLYAVVQRGNRELAALYIAKGADVNAATKDGDTPLHRAAFWGFEEIANLLLEAGARNGPRNRLGRTAADDALRRGHARLAERISGGAPPAPPAAGRGP